MCFADVFQLIPGEHCCDSRTYFIAICIRHRAQQVLRNHGRQKYCTSLNRERCVDFPTVQHLSTAPFNAFSPVVTISGILAGGNYLGRPETLLLGNYWNIISITFGFLNFIMQFMLRNIFTLVVRWVSCHSLNTFPSYLWGAIEQWCWWQWGSHRMGKGKGIARGDKKDNIFWDLFVEGWRTSERRNNFRETKVDLGVPPSVMQSCLVCVC